LYVKRATEKSIASHVARPAIDKLLDRNIQHPWRHIASQVGKRRGHGTAVL
jgi:hypothetical protein